jgi:hypothetical protein
LTPKKKKSTAKKSGAKKAAKKAVKKSVKKIAKKKVTKKAKKKKHFAPGSTLASQEVVQQVSSPQDDMFVSVSEEIDSFTPSNPLP